MQDLLETNEIEVVEISESRALFTRQIQQDQSLTELLKTSSELLELSKKPIVRPEPLILLDGKPFIYPNTINVIQGKAGMHKSRVAAAEASILISEKPIISKLGLQRVSNSPVHTVYIDTERNLKNQYPEVIQNIKLHAGYPIESNAPKFNPITLLKVERKKRLKEIDKLLNKFKTDYSEEANIVVILDVLTDCIKNFNDATESMELSDMLNIMINDHRITIIAVIHENPGHDQNKARGHIGTEIFNKASLAISIAKIKDSDGLFEIQFLKNRSEVVYNPIPIKFDPKSQQLVKADFEDLSSVNDNKAHIRELIKEVIGLLLNKPQERKTLLAQLAIRFNCSKRTIINRLKLIIDSGKMADYGYVLHSEDVPENKNNMKQYRLEKIDAQVGVNFTSV